MKKFSIKFLLLVLMISIIVSALSACNDKVYNITFMTDENVIYKEFEIKDIQSFVMPENPSKEGYDFVKWIIRVDNENQLFDKTFLEKIVEKQDLKVFAEWTIKEHTHSYGDWIISKEPTCDKVGEKYRVCNCEEEEITEIEMLPHSLGNFVIDRQATCTEKGEMSKHCSVCKTRHEITEIEKLPHSLGNFVIDRQATCTDTGEMSKYCSVCETRHEITEIEMLPHNLGDFVIDRQATCTESGEMSKYCSVCKTRHEITEIEKLPHSLGNFVTDIIATCTETGEMSKYCSVCKTRHEITEIEMLPHIYSDFIIDIIATCTTEGEKSKYCIDCDDRIEITIIPVIEHIFSENFTVDIIATCFNEGEKSRHCNNFSECNNKTKVTAIEKTAHILGNEFADGIYKVRKCNSCENDLRQTADGIFYRKTEDKQGYFIYGYIGGVNKDVIIMQTVNNLPVVEIGANAFKDKKINSLNFGSANIKKINENAFENAEISKELVLPQSLEFVGKECFKNSKIALINLNSGLLTISESSFSGINATYLVIPSSVVTIEKNAFANNKYISILVENECEQAGWNNLWLGNEPTVFVNYNLLQISTENGYKYYETTTEIGLLAYVGNIKDFSLPSQIKNKPIVSISAQLLPNNLTVKLPFVNLSENIRFITSYGLKNINADIFVIPSSVKIVGKEIINSNVQDGTVVYCEELNKLENWSTEWVVLSTITKLFGYKIEKFEDNYYALNHRNSDAKYTLVYYAINQTFFTLPTQILGKDVIGMAFKAFYNNTVIKEVSLNENFLSINNFVFANSSLENINCNNSLQWIGEYAFFNTKRLISFNLPDSVMFIEKYAFAQSAIIDLNISESSGLLSISEYAFYNCNNIGKFYLPYSVSEVKTNALNFNDIDKYKYFIYTCLDSIEGGETNWNGGIKVYYNSRYEANEVYEYLIVDETEIIIIKYIGDGDKITIPSTIDDIFVVGLGYGAFANNLIIKEISIPSSIKYAEKESILNCLNARVLIFAIALPEGFDNSWAVGVSIVLLDSPIYGEYNNYSFYTTTNELIIVDYSGEEENVYIPNEMSNRKVTRIYGNVFNNAKIKTIRLPNFLQHIGKNVFAGCTSLDNLIIPLSVETMEESAVKLYPHITILCEASEKPIGWHNNWTSADSKVIFDFNKYATTEDGKYAYAEKNNGQIVLLKYLGQDETVLVPTIINDKTVVEISARSFYGNIYIMNLEIPKSIKTIGVGAFENNINLANVYINDNSQLSEISSNAFKKCSKLVYFNFGENSKVTHINMSAFEKCSKLSAIDLPQSLQYIGAFAFSGLGNLIEIAIPSSVETIDDLAFADCVNLEKILFDENALLTELSESVFNNLINLKSIVLPKGLTNIKADSFSNCSSLAKIYCWFDDVSGFDMGWNSGLSYYLYGQWEILNGEIVIK